MRSSSVYRNGSPASSPRSRRDSSYDCWLTPLRQSRTIACHSGGSSANEKLACPSARSLRRNGSPNPANNSARLLKYGLASSFRHSGCIRSKLSRNASSSELSTAFLRKSTRSASKASLRADLACSLLWPWRRSSNSSYRYSPFLPLTSQW